MINDKTKKKKTIKKPSAKEVSTKQTITSKIQAFEIGRVDQLYDRTESLESKVKKLITQNERTTSTLRYLTSKFETFQGVINTAVAITNTNCERVTSLESTLEKHAEKTNKFSDDTHGLDKVLHNRIDRLTEQVATLHNTFDQDNHSIERGTIKSDIKKIWAELLDVRNAIEKQGYACQKALEDKVDKAEVIASARDLGRVMQEDTQRLRNAVETDMRNVWRVVEALRDYKADNPKSYTHLDMLCQLYKDGEGVVLNYQKATCPMCLNAYQAKVQRENRELEEYLMTIKPED